MKTAEWCSVFIVAGWVLTTPAWAQAPVVPVKESVGQTPPSLEFLEFLGEFETEEGEWIDPEELEQMDLMDQPETHTQKTEENRD